MGEHAVVLQRHLTKDQLLQCHRDEMVFLNHSLYIKNGVEWFGGKPEGLSVKAGYNDLHGHEDGITSISAPERTYTKKPGMT